MKDRKRTVSAIWLSLMVLLVCVFSGREFRAMHIKEPLYPSPGLTSQRMLSDYLPGLRGTPGDTEVLIFEGGQPGGHVLVLGGTHPNEPAGFVTAVLLAENIRVQRGKLIVIPQANSSGFTHNDPHEGSPQRFSILTPGGPRWFRCGSRLTNPVHQWPDPSLYTNPPGQKLSGAECRNLNRCYPGRQHGLLTERIAFGVMALIRQEKIDLAVDLHEAAPEYPVINAIVFHENCAELAALASMELQMEGVDIRLEASPPNLRGLSHREWGDAGGIMAILLETANASHGRLKGRPSGELILEGKDKNYVKAARLGRLFVPFGEEGIPLRERTARHLASVQALLSGLEALDQDKALEVSGIPPSERVLAAGIGAFLHHPNPS